MRRFWGIRVRDGLDSDMYLQPKYPIVQLKACLSQTLPASCVFEAPAHLKSRLCQPVLLFSISPPEPQMTLFKHYLHKLSCRLCKFITFRQVTIPHTEMWDVSFGLGVKNVAKLQLALSPPAALEFFQSASPACSVVRRKGHSIKDFHCARQIDSPERAECPEVHWCFNVKPHTHTHTLPRPAFEILTEYYSSRLKLLPRHLSCILGAIYIDCCCSAGSRRVCCGIM